MRRRRNSSGGLTWRFVLAMSPRCCPGLA
jgi:hypothetical protein